MPKIVYDRKNCEGYFVCVAMDPANFEEAEDPDGEPKAAFTGDFKEVSDGLYEKEISEDELDDALEATTGCPADVLKVIDDDGNVIEGPKELPIEQ